MLKELAALLGSRRFKTPLVTQLESFIAGYNSRFDPAPLQPA
jgi:hypothetical protein